MSTPSTREALDAAMVRLADGDRTAIEEVYRSLWPIVLRYCARLVGDSDADDVAQSALLKLFEQAHNYDRSKSTITWALTIAAWQCRTYRRKQGRKRDQLERLRQTAAANTSNDASEEVWRRDAIRALKEIVSDMPVRDQDALADAFVRELSTPVHRKRKQRVLERLRRRWKELHGED